MAILTIRKTLLLALLIALALGVFAVFRIQQHLEVRDSTWDDFASHLERDLVTRVVCALQGENGPLGAMTMPTLTDASEWLGQGLDKTTFAISVADLDNDRLDDVLIGTHGKRPHLLMNQGGAFANRPSAIFSPDEPVPDLHGYTLVDLDGDTDLDLAIAAGGANGVGEGSGNMFYRNVGDRTGPEFRREPVSAAIENTNGRSRTYIPLPSKDGSSIDLYYTSLPRKGVTNELLVNRSDSTAFNFEVDSSSYLTRVIKDHGVGTFADFNGDGHRDYLVVDGPKLKIYWHPASGREPTTFAYNAFSTAAGDFNNDGHMDIYIGRFNFDKGPDLVAHSPRNIVFDIKSRGPQPHKEISFRSGSNELRFSLFDPPSLQEVLPDTNPGTIYLGSDMTSPAARQFVVTGQQAQGAPDEFAKDGTYIWFSAQTQQWHVRWQRALDNDNFTGTIQGRGFSELETEGLVSRPASSQRDTILLNRGNGRFREHCSALSPHQAVTSGLTVVDLNSDGWLDVVGVRHGRLGEANGELFILANQSGAGFVQDSINLQQQDLLARPDKVVHGFFNDDNQPDLVVTTGFGYGGGMGPRGAPRLFLNSTPQAGRDLALDLVGLPGNSEAVGAKVSLFDAANKLVATRERGLNANLSQDTHVIHFGLGSAPAPFRAVVEWANGSTTTADLDQPGRYTLRQDAAD